MNRSPGHPLIPAQAGIQRKIPLPAETYGDRSSVRSRQSGLKLSIRWSFQDRFHFLICRSRMNADSRDSCTSYQKSCFTPYFFLKPEAAPMRCSQLLRTRSSVIPIYSVPFLRLPKIYTKKLMHIFWVPAFAVRSGQWAQFLV